MKGKKGTHVEIVLSFVLFVGAVFFIFLIFEKDFSVKSTPSSFISFKENLKEEIKANLTSITINVPTPSSQNCIVLSNFLSNFNGLSKIIARDELQKIEADIQGNDLFLNSGGGKLYFIYNSSEFQEESSSLSNCENSEYSLGQVKKQEIIFESKILNLTSEYEQNYEQLKTKLKIPKNRNFGFSFIYSNNTVISTKEAIPEVNVYAEEETIIYITNEGEIQVGKLIFRIW
jgi:hypothetical protein